MIALDGRYWTFKVHFIPARTDYRLGPFEFGALLVHYELVDKDGKLYHRLVTMQPA